ncbi:hypothetical protein PL8927_720144 [Planktothrix serta PCC 8927]|uniref:Uncharacterized protein n=1 Tax=Planktothrix serta PCC 8927 TaxID=671068 RepID=A0A7Z9E1T9_9CYAN|nr:hypothetical protein [Planktothrix serta]VXD21684.1 hypothetical protein PL8927_720144 [Planktothrix serta PCC 8927]
MIDAKLYLKKRLIVEITRGINTEEFFSIIHRPLITDRFLGLLEWLANQFGESTSGGYFT